MTKTYIKGDTIPKGLTLTWQDSETGERTYEDIEFNDYFYISIEDFYLLRKELKDKWKKYLRAVIEIQAKNEYDRDETFAKIIMSDNTKKYLIKTWLEEKDIKAYEIDFNTTKRYVIDNYKNLNLGLLNSRYIFYDLETDDRKNFKYDPKTNKVIAENTILSFSADDFKGDHFFFINENAEDPNCEKELLLKIKNLLMKYSIISAWNGNNFDDEYLKARAKLHGIGDFTPEVNLIDYMFSYKKYKIEEPLDSYSLDNVAELELGEKKIDIKKGGGRVYKLYLTDKKKLEEYNSQDTLLMYRLNKKLRFMELHLMTAHLGHCNVQLTNYNKGANEYLILMKAKKKNLIAPSDPTKEEKERRRKIGNIGGGLTRGEAGLYEEVAVFDFNSLYPSTEITYNISPEKFVRNVTVEEEKQWLEKKDADIEVFKNHEELKEYCIKNNLICTPSDYTYVAKQGRKIYHPCRLYKGDSIGLLPSVMIELIEERAKIKKEMKNMDKNSDEYVRAYTTQLSLKYSLVSSYGLNALPSYRFFRWDVADSITTSGRVNIKRIREFCRENGFKTVYSDTDSVGISPESSDCPSFEEFDKMLVKHIDEMLKDTNNNVYKRTDEYGEHNHRLMMEWEKTFTPLLYKRKKRYAGRIIDRKGNEEIKIVGLESTKMNNRAAILQKEFIEDILKGNFDKEKWKIKMKDLYNKCFNGEMEAEDLIISMKFTERAVDMKAPRAHTMLAERMIEQGLDVAVGDKIQYIVQSTTPKQYAVTVEEFNKKREYPANYYWDVFTKPLISLMSIVKDIDVFEIVRVPELEKLEKKLLKLKEDSDSDEKIIKLTSRINKMREKILDNSIDEEENDDSLLSYD